MALLAEEVGGSDALVSLDSLENPRLPLVDASLPSSTSPSASSIKSLALGRAEPSPHITEATIPSVQNSDRSMSHTLVLPAAI